MRVSRVVRAFVFLILVARVADAGAECVGELLFGNDGHTIKWRICNADSATDIVNPASGALKVALWVGNNGARERFQWSQADKLSADKYEFRALNAAGTIELTRHISEVSTNEFVQNISVSNLSPDDLVDVKLQVRFGLPADRGVDEPAGLAKQIYGFQRYLQYTDSGEWHLVDEKSTGSRFALYSRHRVLVLDTSKPMTLIRDAGSIDADDRYLEAFVGRIVSQSSAAFRFTASALSTSTPLLTDANHRGLMYSHLWQPLAAVSRGVERMLAKLTAISGNAGLAMIILAILIRIVTSPITYWSFRQQKKFTAINLVMKPAISEIRSLYKGAEQSERILAVYKQHNISPFSGLKGSVGLFIQIPFLLAVFHVTTESSLLEHAHFLWIKNLALSDSLVVLPFTLPILGNAVNILPLGLGILNLLSGKRQSSESGTSSIIPVVVSLVIVVLFYTVSAALVLYWFAANVLQMFERTVFNRRLGQVASDEVTDDESR